MKDVCGGTSKKIYLMSEKQVERKEKVVTVQEIRRDKCKK
jgi:hypothetical protein